MKTTKLATTITAALAAATLTLTGCSATPDSAPEPSAPVEMVAEDMPEETEEATVEASYDELVKPFGETITMADPGADVTVKYLGNATANDTSTSGAVPVIEFSIAIENTGSTPIEGYDVIFEGLYGGDSGEPFEEVYDMDNGWSGPEYSKIMPGRTQTVKTAFEAPEPGLVSFMMSIGWSETVVFEGDLSE